MEFKQDIFQCYISPTLSYFKNDWMARWNLSDYVDPNKPCLFFGVYKQYELEYLLNHNSKSVVLWAGGDICDENEDVYLDKIQSACAKSDCYHFPSYIPEPFKKFGAKINTSPPEVKDYSRFKPVPLGDKIYTYMGYQVHRKEQFNWDSIIIPIIEHFGKDKVIFSKDSSIEDIHENFYKKSFVNLKPNPAGGNQTMIELANMGIKTITPKYQGPQSIVYKNLDHIIDIIEEESKKIGTIQEQVRRETREYWITDFRWLNFDWLEKNCKSYEV